MTKAMSKSIRTRERVLDAAARVFAESGYANARLSDIAEGAGIQTGSLYYHFDSRESLVVEVLQIGLERAMVAVQEALAESHDLGAAGQFRAALRAHVVAVLDSGHYVAAQARSVGQVPPEIRQMHLADQKRYGQLWDRLYKALEHEGLLHEGADRFALRMLAFGALNWTVEWQNSTRLTRTAIVDQAVDFVFRATVISNSD